MKYFKFKNISLSIFLFFFLFSINVGLCEGLEEEIQNDSVPAVKIVKPEIVDSTMPLSQDEEVLIDDEIVNPVINPATKYCIDLGYKWEKKMTADGEAGICVMPDGVKLEEWDFALGREGEEWSYCEKNGYELKIISNVDKCQNVLSEECAVCVTDDGTLMEVTKLLASDVENNRVVVEKKGTKVLALVLLFSIIILMMIFAYLLLVKDKVKDKEKEV